MSRCELIAMSNTETHVFWPLSRRPKSNDFRLYTYPTFQSNESAVFDVLPLLIILQAKLG